jgi:hypothetical protein
MRHFERRYVQHHAMIPGLQRDVVIVHVRSATKQRQAKDIPIEADGTFDISHRQTDMVQSAQLP